MAARKSKPKKDDSEASAPKKGRKSKKGSKKAPPFKSARAR
jgi:hypothetical protein